MIHTRIDERWITKGKEKLILEDYLSDINGVKLYIPLRYREDQLLGFITDGGTIPPIAWPVMGHPFGEFFFCYLNHDYRWSMTWEFPGMTFSDSNDLLYSDLLYYGASKARAYTVYRAVQTGGKGIWKRGREKVGDLDYHYGIINA